MEVSSFCVSHDMVVSLVPWVCPRGHVSVLAASDGPSVRASALREALPTCPKQAGRKRDPREAELSAILLSFMECEAKQE